MLQAESGASFSAQVCEPAMSSAQSSPHSSILLPLAAAVLFSVLAGYVGWTIGASEGSEPDLADPTSPAILTEFRLPSLDGRQIGPADFEGRVLVVDFWATWCSPCRVQARILDSLHDEYSADEVGFLAVSLGEDEETVRKFVDKNPFPYPVLYDEQDLVATGASVYALPTVMVVDRRGQVSYLRSGLSGAKALREALDGAAG